MSGALIVTAGLGDADFARFDRLRRAHYPADRNQLPAHLTMFHALPPSVAEEVAALLKQLARQAPPAAHSDGLLKLGQGVAVRVQSDGLTALRERIADRFHGSLGAQDSAGWRPHITIQNKVTATAATALHNQLLSDWRDASIRITALELHRYMGGPWSPIGRYPFRG